MKKVLHVVEAFGGGIISFLLELTNNTNDKYKITIAYGERDDLDIEVINKFANNIEFVKINNFTREINFKKDYLSLKEIIALDKKNKYDIIHLHSSKAGVLGRLAFFNTRRTVLYTPHGFSFLMTDCSRLKRKVFWAIEKVCSYSDGIIVACSIGEYKEAKKISRKSVVINNGLDIAKINQEFKGTTNKKSPMSICTVGRICDQKNPSLFNEIAKALPEQSFTWIGDGEDKMKLNSANIQITGWLSREEVISHLSESTIFILTSKWEGLPIALLEAMYAKNTCIVSDCVGNRDVIINNVNGFICKSLHDYTNTINMLVRTPELPLVIGDEAQKEVISKYNIHIMISNYIKLYNGEELLNEKNSDY